jgi:hypothetical protein
MRQQSWPRGEYFSVTDVLCDARKLEAMRTVTFRQAVTEFLRSSKLSGFKSDKHCKQWDSTLRSVFPALGDLPLNAITGGSTVSSLKPNGTVKTNTPPGLRRSKRCLCRTVCAQGGLHNPPNRSSRFPSVPFSPEIWGGAFTGQTGEDSTGGRYCAPARSSRTRRRKRPRGLFAQSGNRGPRSHKHYREIPQRYPFPKDAL